MLFLFSLGFLSPELAVASASRVLLLLRRLFAVQFVLYCIADSVLTVAKGKLMADKLLASGGMTKDKSVRDVTV